MSNSNTNEEQHWSSLNENEEAVSNRLRLKLIADIETNSGTISFDQFLQVALYEPGLGYYNSCTKKFGIEGDFITAPEISSLYSKTIARQCGQILNDLGGGDILELGAGTGVMAKDILLSLEKSASLPEHYFILEPSPELRGRQKETIENLAGHLLDHVIWLVSEPETSFSGVILANEIVDALPFKRIVLEQGKLFEYRVACEDENFVWQKQENPAIAKLLPDSFSGQSISESYTTEVHSFVPGWLETLSNWLQSGVLLIVDYGESNRDFYHPENTEGSLRCYYRHRVHGDPFINIGLQDITCNVNFSELASFAQQSGMDLLGYTTQTNFLLGCGIEEIFADSHIENDSEKNQKEYFQKVQQLKTLTMPEEMGERFKFIAFAKNYSQALMGFSFKDLSDRL